MPRIDPLKLLSCLKVLLAPNGGIKSSSEVKRLAGLMTKYSKKLVSKCVYIQILKCSNTELLEQFMSSGGWSLTHMWLSEAVRAKNSPLVQEILELLLLCPVDIVRLKSNVAPKLVKHLCRDGGNEGVRILATKLVEQWLKIVKDEGTMAMISNNSNASTSVDNNTDLNCKLDNLQQPIVVEDENPVLSNDGVNNNYTNENLKSNINEDPLDVPVPVSIIEANPRPPETGLVYKIVIKDGKQVLAKVENISEVDSNIEEISPKIIPCVDEASSNKENAKNKEKNVKEIHDKSKTYIKDKEKKKSSSSSHRSSSSQKSSSSDSKYKSSSNKSNSSNSSNKSKSSSSSSSHKSSSTDKNSKKDDKSHRSSSKSSNSSSSSQKDRDRHRGKDKEKEKEKKSSSSNKDRSNEKNRDNKTEKDKNSDEKSEKEINSENGEKNELLSKFTLNTLDTLKITKIDDSIPTSIQIPSKKASISIELRRDTEVRPKTVKAYNSQFRSHGLGEEAPPPPSRKGLKKPIVQTITGTSIISNNQFKRSSPPPSSSSSSNNNKDTQQISEKKIKIDVMSTNSTNEKPGSIKLIAAKPKPSLLMESGMFMDALSASALPKKDARKRKRRTSTSKDTSKESNTTNSPPESPGRNSGNSVAPLKFYQDTLEDKDEEKSELIDSKDENMDEDEDDKREDEDDIPLKRVKDEIAEKVRKEQEDLKNKDENDQDLDDIPKIRVPGPGCGPNGPHGVLMLHRRKGPKKKLTWKPNDELEEFRYFELDETERVNVTKTFTDMKQMERINEREGFILARKLNTVDHMIEQTPWRALIIVDDVPPHPDGSQSKEKKIQGEREQTTLKALYFTRHMIPDSPAEPDMEQYQITEPAVIPLDDITGNPDAVNDFTNMPWPDPKGSPPPMSEEYNQCNPELGFQQTQFNPFIQYPNPNWPMVPPPNGMMPNNIMPNNVIPNNVMPNGVMPNGMMLNPMGGFNMRPQNMMMRPTNTDNIQIGMNMMRPPFVPPMQNFCVPNNVPPPNFNYAPRGMNMGMNMNNGRSSGRNNVGGMMGNIGNNSNVSNSGGGSGGNWRSGLAGPPERVSGGNWRQGGQSNSGSSNKNWIYGNNNRICKAFQRGNCRNGLKCNFLHTNNKNHNF